MPLDIDLAAIDAFISTQKIRDPSIINAIKAVREHFGVNLAIAKRLVEQHPAWFSVVEANRPFQELAEQIFKELDSNSK